MSDIKKRDLLARLDGHQEELEGLQDQTESMEAEFVVIQRELAAMQAQNHALRYQAEGLVTTLTTVVQELARRDESLTKEFLRIYGKLDELAKLTQNPASETRGHTRAHPSSPDFQPKEEAQPADPELERLLAEEEEIQRRGPRLRVLTGLDEPLSAVPVTKDEPTDEPTDGALQRRIEVVMVHQRAEFETRVRAIESDAEQEIHGVDDEIRDHFCDEIDEMPDGERPDGD